MGADAAGVVVALFAFNGLGHRYQWERDIEGWYLLQDFAVGHEQAGLISGAID